MVIIAFRVNFIYSHVTVYRGWCVLIWSAIYVKVVRINYLPALYLTLASTVTFASVFG